LENFGSFIDNEQSPTILLEDGSILSADQILASIQSPGIDIEPAAGEAGPDSGGVSEYEDNPGAILDGIEKLDGLEFDQPQEVNPPQYQGLNENAGGDAQPDSTLVDTTPPNFIINDVGDTSDNTPTITGTAEPGSTIMLEVGDVTLTTTADAEGHWTVTVPDATPLSDGVYTIDGTATDSAGNMSTDSGTLGVDTTAYATIALDADITSDDIIAADELGEDIAITGTVGGDVADGDIVTVTVNGATYTGAVSNGTFSIDVPTSQLAADPDHIIEASVTGTDPLGNAATATDTEAYSVNAVIGGDDIGEVTEDADNPSLTDSGTLTINDGDAGEAAFDPDSVSGSEDALGSLSINAAGEWTYSVDNGAVQYLGDGETKVETFTVTSVDGTAHTVTITINGTNDGPVLEDVDISLSEEGLPDGITDNAGSVDTTDSTTISGTMSIADADGDALDVTLSAPAEDLTSGGQAIDWDGEGTQTLTGYAGGVEVIEISIDNDGAYTVELKGPIDHPANSVEDIHSFGVGVTADDGTTSSTGTLTVHVEDDMPVADSVNTINATAPGDANTNLLIILDNSGSMRWGSGVDGKSRLALAKEAIEDLVNAYDDAGNVAVRLVTFNAGSEALGSGWVSASEALDLLNSISAGGATNYDAALETAISAFKSDGTDEYIDGAPNVSYFLSDGEPTRGDATLGIDTDEQGVWTDFLNLNSINSYALGMGTGVSQDSMNPIAHNGVTGMDSVATVVTDLNQLSEVLYSTVNTSVSGELVSADAGADFGFGADGGYIQTLEIDGDTYTFDPGNDTIDVTGSGSTTYTFSDVNSQLLITTAAGGELTVNMGTGSYTYNGPTDQTQDFQEHIGFTLSDNDGDTSSGNLTLQVFADGSSTIELNGTDAIDLIDGTAEADTIDGGSGNDILVGGDGDDLIIGGLDHDTMSGGNGSDTFVFSANGGEGNDTINDFDVATDVIRLSDVLDADGDNDFDINDLLQDGGQNVAATVSGADVELTISHGGESTVVTLTGINADHTFDGASTLTDLIEHGLQIDIM
jgi:T1SS-143 domain-containing protein